MAADRAVAAQGGLTARARLSLYADHTQDAAQVDAFVLARAEAIEPGGLAGTVKIFVDGVIEAATAALVDPYLPLPAEPRAAAPPSRGLPNCTDRQLQTLVTRLDREGFQVPMHAIGDGAVRQALDAIAAADRVNGRRDRRAHIAHLELVQPDDLPRFRQLGVIANLQPLWASRDAYIPDLTEPRLGPVRSCWLYPFGALQRAGAMLVGGSDWSVSSVNALDAIPVAVTRRAPTAPAGAPPWLPDERLDRPTALAADTIGGAYVSFEERDRDLPALPHHEPRLVEHGAILCAQFHAPLTGHHRLAAERAIPVGGVGADVQRHALTQAVILVPAVLHAQATR